MKNNKALMQRMGLIFLLVFGRAFALDAQPVTSIPKVKLDTLVIENIDVIDHGDKLSWYAKVRNIGNAIEKNKLEISGYQLIGNRQISTAGEKLVWDKRFNKNQLNNFTKQNWSRAKHATALKIVVKNLQTGQYVSKIVPIPKQNNKPSQDTNNFAGDSVGPQNADILNEKPELEVVEAAYKGQGAFEVKIKNIGQRGFMPDEIEIRPIYHIRGKLPVIGRTVTNRSAINVNEARKAFSSYPNIYNNGMSECVRLEKLTLEITNKVTSRQSEYIINNISRPNGEITSVDLEGSSLTYTVHNTGDYTTKYNLRTISFGIYNWETAPTSNIPVYHGNLIKELKDLFHASITLKAGETGSVTIDPQRVNNEIKKQFPKMKKDEPYMAQYFMLELFLKGSSGCLNRDIVISQPSFRESSSNTGFAIIDRR